MSNKEIILKQSSLSKSEKDKDIEFYNANNDLKEKKRSNLIQSIFNSSRETAKASLKNNELYKVAFDTQSLQKGKDGFFRGVIYDKSGKIVEHAKLEKVNSTIVNTIRTAGTQAMLLNICIQLSDIQKSIQELSIEFHNDRISQLHSKIELFELAQSFTREQRVKQIENIYQFIIEGVLKLVYEIKSNTKRLEKINNGFFSNWVKSSTQWANEIIPQIEESTFYIYRGIDVGIKSLIALEQPQEAINKFLQGSVEKLKQIDFTEIQEKSRFCESKQRHFPEHFFNKVKNANKSMIQEYKNALSLYNDENAVISIEFNSNEILGDQNGKL